MSRVGGSPGSYDGEVHMESASDSDVGQLPTQATLFGLTRLFTPPKIAASITMMMIRLVINDLLLNSHPLTDTYCLYGISYRLFQPEIAGKIPRGSNSALIRRAISSALFSAGSSSSRSARRGTLGATGC